MQDNSEQWRSKEEVVAGPGEQESDGGNVGSATGRPVVQRLAVVSLAVSLEKMRGIGGNDCN